MFGNDRKSIKQGLMEAFEKNAVSADKITDNSTEHSLRLTVQLIPNLSLDIYVREKVLKILTGKEGFFIDGISNSDTKDLEKHSGYNFFERALPFINKQDFYDECANSVSKLIFRLQAAADDKEHIDLLLRERRVPLAFSTHLCFKEAALDSKLNVTIINPLEDYAKGFRALGYIDPKEDLQLQVDALTRAIFQKSKTFTSDGEINLKDRFSLQFVNLDKLTGSSANYIEAELGTIPQRATTLNLSLNLYYSLITGTSPETNYRGSFKTTETTHDHGSFKLLGDIKDLLVPQLLKDLPKYRAAYQAVHSMQALSVIGSLK
jgi:hypothetical protein